jgi:hypothetical protein
VINLYRNKNPSESQKGSEYMPSVMVVPVYVEVSSGFDRAVDTLESHLRRAGYLFHIGEPLSEDLETTKARFGVNQPAESHDDGQVGAGVSSGA